MSPSWTDETGYDWFGKLECKRCLQRFDAVDGEVPVHECVGGELFKSASDGREHHFPVRVERKGRKK